MSFLLFENQRLSSNCVIATAYIHFNLSKEVKVLRFLKKRKKKEKDFNAIRLRSLCTNWHNSVTKSVSVLSHMWYVVNPQMTLRQLISIDAGERFTIISLLLGRSESQSSQTKAWFTVIMCDLLDTTNRNKLLLFKICPNELVQNHH